MTGAILAFTLLSSSVATAAPAITITAQSSGITVAPAQVIAQVGSKQLQTTTTIGVRNNFDATITVTAVLNGFDVRNNALVPTTIAERSLSGVVSLSPAEITIPPGGSKNINVNVHDTDSLSPGGHYLSILLTETAENGRPGSSQLSLKPAVSATLYVIKEDGAVRSIQAQSLRLNHSLFSLPKTADATFFNNGNVPSVPRGVVQVSRSVNSSALAQGVLNQQSAPLYQNSSITLQAKLQKLAAVRLPGQYRASLQYRYDGQDSTNQITSTFWYIPKVFVAVTLLVITGITLLIWPENQQRLRRLWHSAHQKKRQPFIAPDTSKIAKAEAFGSANEEPNPTRRKIDDIHRPN